MAGITYTLAPGWYNQLNLSTTIFWPSNALKVLITNTTRSPTLSEVIAKDNVGDPFIAVTQDGKGNVVYDGGFPKFLNYSLMVSGAYPASPPATFAALLPAHRYMHNAMKWVANKTKVNGGNKKILVVGNTDVSASYPLKGSHYTPAPNQSSADNGFVDVMRAIANVAGFQLTFYDLSDAGGTINLGLDNMDPYVAVIFIASQSPTGKNSSKITERFAKELSTYRELGNGVIIITDHTGGTYTNVDQALAEVNGIFAYDATKCAAYYGAFFSGDVDRTSVLVSNIRAQLIAAGGDGTHPLLNNLADDSSIFAGGSESIIKVEDYTASLKDPAQPVTYALSTANEYRYNVLVQLNDADRTIETQPLRYIIRNPSDLTMVTNKGVAIGSSFATNKPYLDTVLKYTGTDGSTLRGRITLNDNLIGYFQHIEGQPTKRFLLSGLDTTMPLQANQTLAYKVDTPFRFDITTNVALRDKIILNDASYQMATFIRGIGVSADYAQYTFASIKQELFDAGSKFYKEWNETVEYPIALDWEFMRWARRPWNKSTLGTMLSFVASDAADWTARKPNTGDYGDSAILADTGTVYTFDPLTTVWTLHPQTAAQLFGVGRTVKGRDGKIFRIAENGLTLVQ